MAENKKKGQDSKKGRPSGAGHRKGKFEGFFLRTEERKLRRVLKRNGAVAAKAYVKAGHASNALLHKISKESSVAGNAAKAAFQAN